MELNIKKRNTPPAWIFRVIAEITSIADSTKIVYDEKEIDILWNIVNSVLDHQTIWVRNKTYSGSSIKRELIDGKIIIYTTTGLQPVCEISIVELKEE